MKPLAHEGSMADRATSALRTAILNGDLEPDTLHAVHTVADSLGVSRTPVREALIRLAADGLVRVQRNRGFVVLHTSAEDLRQIFSLRLLLEVPATRAAALAATGADIAALEADIGRMREARDADDAETFLRADRQFHRTLLTISGNDRLAEFVDGLRNVVLGTGVSTANRTESIEEILQPHVEILGLVRTHDADGAARSMREHLLHTARKLIGQEFGEDESIAFDEVLGRFGAT
ncbi:GntR family transcriptional regulator [Aeromicrobium sp. 50.2.37]|nr:GntR family transcriptional regulator [Aeromicrobium sp. 50.2.37]